MKTRGTYSRILRNAAAILAIGVVATVGLTPQGASAATAPAPNVKTCFYYGNGYPASGNVVKLYEASPTATSWTYAWYGTTGSNGCLTFAGMHRGYRYYAKTSRTYGNANTGWAFFSGRTPVGWTGSTGTLALNGWLGVTCVAGLYGRLC